MWNNNKKSWFIVTNTLIVNVKSGEDSFRAPTKPNQPTNKNKAVHTKDTIPTNIRVVTTEKFTYYYFFFCCSNLAATIIIIITIIIITIIIIIIITIIIIIIDNEIFLGLGIYTKKNKVLNATTNNWPLFFFSFS